LTCNWPGPAAPLHARTENNSRGGSRAKPGKLPFAITPQDRAEGSRPKSRMTQISGASLRIARPRPTSTRLAYDDRRQDCPTPASHLLEQFEGVEHCNDPQASGMPTKPHARIKWSRVVPPCRRPCVAMIISLRHSHFVQHFLLHIVTLVDGLYHVIADEADDVPPLCTWSHCMPVSSARRD
jgi:hypothetical protein